jgi:hypothetical protein
MVELIDMLFTVEVDAVCPLDARLLTYVAADVLEEVCADRSENVANLEGYASPGVLKIPRVVELLGGICGIPNDVYDSDLDPCALP